MPLVDLLREKWRRMRAERARGEESRRQVFESLNAAEKDRACREIARWLKKADSSSAHSDDYYYSQAEQRIAGFRWQLHKLNQPFIWLEKKIIEPLDFWSKRANVFQFFERVSPLLEAVGVLAIPIVIFYFESQREERQIRFEENLIAAQSEVRQRQVVRDYLSQITTIYLEVKERDDIRKNKDLKKLLEATTLAIFDELSFSEDFWNESVYDAGLGWQNIGRDRRGRVIDFLSNLGWINSSNDEEPLLSLRESNLSQADLWEANLRGADLRGANLWEANLGKANLWEANLGKANLGETFLGRVNLRGANLTGANLTGAKDLTPKQIKSACDWEKAIYKENESENTKYIEELKKDKSSDPKEPPDCSRWNN